MTDWKDASDGSEITFSHKGIEITVIPSIVCRERDHYAARLLQLGLTAYEDSPEKALQKLHKMFAIWVDAHERVGTLEKILNGNKVLELKRGGNESFV